VSSVQYVTLDNKIECFSHVHIKLENSKPYLFFKLGFNVLLGAPKPQLFSNHKYEMGSAY